MDKCSICLKGWTGINYEKTVFRLQVGSERLRTIDFFESINEWRHSKNLPAIHLIKGRIYFRYIFIICVILKFSAYNITFMQKQNKKTILTGFCIQLQVHSKKHNAWFNILSLSLSMHIHTYRWQIYTYILTFNVYKTWNKCITR